MDSYIDGVESGSWIGSNVDVLSMICLCILRMVSLMILTVRSVASGRLRMGDARGHGLNMLSNRIISYNRAHNFSIVLHALVYEYDVFFHDLDAVSMT